MIRLQVSAPAPTSASHHGGHEFTHEIAPCMASSLLFHLGYRNPIAETLPSEMEWFVKT